MLNTRFLRLKVYRSIKKRSSSQSRIFLPCFYCSADSTELKVFIILTIGGLVLCSILAFLGFWFKGSFKDTEKLSDCPLKIEDEGKSNE